MTNRPSEEWTKVIADPGTANLVHQAETIATDLVPYLESLPSASWSGPSDCAGWSIADVVAHQILVEDLLGGSIVRGLDGDSGPPELAQNGVEAWREHRVNERVRLKDQPPKELLEQFRQSLGRMSRALEALVEASPTNQKGWFAQGPQPLPWFAGQWLVEIALHDWDIRVAGDPDTQVSAAGISVLGPEMRRRMMRCFQPDQAQGPAGVVRINLQNSVPTSWLARLDTGKLELLDDGTEPADAEIQTDAGTYALVQTGRRPVDQFRKSGAWTESEDRQLISRLLKSLKGY